MLKVKREKGAQSCPTLCDPMVYTVHGMLQARILEWVAFPFSRGSSQPRHRTQASRIAGRFFTSWVTRETQYKMLLVVLPTEFSSVFSSFFSLLYQTKPFSQFSHVWLFVTPWTAARQVPCPSPTPGASSNSYPLSWWCHSTISSCHPLLLLPSIFPSRVFSSESVLRILWPKY